MQIYFGQTINPFDEAFVLEDSRFETPEAYYFALEYGSGPAGCEDIVLHDTVGRSLPINVDSIPELMMALEKVLEINEAIAKGDEFRKQVVDPSYTLGV